MPTIVLCKYVLAIALVRIVLLGSLYCESEGSVACFNPNLLEHVGAMRLQQKRMMVETTRAFVKLKQNKAAVSVGGTKFTRVKKMGTLLRWGTLKIPLILIPLLF